MSARRRRRPLLLTTAEFYFSSATPIVLSVADHGTLELQLLLVRS